MYKKELFLMLFGYLIAGSQGLQAHSHHHVYIVEQEPPQVVIVEQAPPQVVVIQQTPAPIVNVVAIENQPPEDLYEQVDGCPGAGYVWQKGHWQWNGSWAWTKGNWAQPPHENGIYVPGYWRKSHHHWEWVAPHWK